MTSPNAEEALSFFSPDLFPTKAAIEEAAAKFMGFGVGEGKNGSVIIRCGEMGAYVLTRERGGQWIDAFWREAKDDHRVVDVTGRCMPAINIKSQGTDVTLKVRGTAFWAVLPQVCCWPRMMFTRVPASV
jgi:hypothetical protein